MDFDGEHTRLPIDPDLAPDDPAEPSRTHTVTPKAARHGRARPDVLLAIALGGSLGTLARYGVAQVIHVAKGSFPWATFWENVSGSLVLGVALVLIVERFPPSRYARPFAAVGFLGAYTTFSTYATAMPAWPSLTSRTVSTENVENVVYAPRNPTATNART